MGDSRYEIDFSRANTSDFLLLLKGELPDVLSFADKVIVGGINDRPMSDLPEILRFTFKKVAEFADQTTEAMSLEAMMKNIDDMLGGDKDG